MHSEEEILDNPEKEPIVVRTAENRVWKDLTIVVGVVYLILSIMLFYHTITTISAIVDSVLMYGFSLGDIQWFRLIARNSPGLIYAIFFIVGAVGLFRRLHWGWTASMSIAIFALVFPLVRLIIGLVGSNTSGVPIWVLFLVALGFGLVILYLLLKPTRKLFNLTRKSYVVVAISVLVLILHRFVLPLI